MTIADDPEKPRQAKSLAKSRDAIAALKAAMEQKLAESQAPKLKEEPPPRPAAPPEPPRAKTTSESADDIKMPDPTEWSRIMLRIADRGQKLMRAFLERNQNSAAKLPPMPFSDPGHVGEAFAELMGRILDDPERFVDAQISLAQNYIKLWQMTLAKMQGKSAQPVAAPAPGDKRFQDQDWQNIWLFDFIKQSYLLTARWVHGLVRKQTQGLDPKLVQKIDFYTKQMVDAIAPSNFWLTNPQVLRATMESGGENFVKGLENLLDDLERGNGQLQISMSDPEAFKVGGDLAITPGKVVFQNELIQLIQYAPQTPVAHRVPLLLIPPWINKYYILDLREKNSFIRYLVAQGYTVFCVSWVNPGPQHAKINFEDYLTEGAFAALRAIKVATGEDAVNVLGYCIGGTLLATALAYLKAADEPPPGLPQIPSATFLVALTDFSEPGDLGVFIDEDQVKAIEARMAKQGYLDAASMATTFNMLRANDLIWSFVVNNYLLGREPFPFDILYWNADSTNLPAAMHSFYLRKMYLENRLVEPNGIRMKGVPIDLRRIDTPAFLLSTHDDHIAPWRSTYAATQLYKGPVTFVLAGSGHIAGIVNPPSAEKYGYWMNAQCPPDPNEWFKAAAQYKGSWWPAWLDWLRGFSGEMVPAREIKDGIEDAPGSYVKARAV